MSVNGIAFFTAPASSGIVGTTPVGAITGGIAFKQGFNLTTGQGLSLSSVCHPFAPDNDTIYYAGGAASGNTLMVVF